MVAMVWRSAETDVVLVTSYMDLGTEGRSLEHSFYLLGKVNLEHEHSM